MMTKIWANITTGVGGGRAWVLDQDSGGWEGDPLIFSDLNLDDIVGVYWASGRRGGWRWDAKGQGYGSKGCGVVSNLFQVVMLLSLGKGEEDLNEGRVEDVGEELFQVAVEEVGDEEVQDWSRQQGEGGVKGQAKWSKEIVWTCLEMLELCEGDMMKELDQELIGDILLVWRESFDSDGDGKGGDGRDEESMDVRHGKKVDLDGGCIGQGWVGRFIRGRGWEIWHSYEGGLECWWK